jgi:hypothetical protein
MSKKSKSNPHTDPQYPINPETGMPYAPEGMFWRVFSDGWSESVSVQLRRTKRWGRSEWIGQGRADTHIWKQDPREDPDNWSYTQADRETIEQRIRVAATDILRRRDKKREKQSAIAKVVGDYPPNKLG